MKTICCNRPKYALYKIDVFGSFEVAKRRTTEAEKNQIITKIGVTTKKAQQKQVFLLSFQKDTVQAFISNFYVRGSHVNGL